MADEVKIIVWMWLSLFVNLIFWTFFAYCFVVPGYEILDFITLVLWTIYTVVELVREAGDFDE